MHYRCVAIILAFTVWKRKWVGDHSCWWVAEIIMTTVMLQIHVKSYTDCYRVTWCYVAHAGLPTEHDL